MTVGRYSYRDSHWLLGNSIIVGGWNSEPESDDESKSITSSVGERRIKSAALLLSGRSRVRVAPAPLGNEEDNHSQTSSTSKSCVVSLSWNDLLWLMKIQ